MILIIERMESDVKEKLDTIQLLHLTKIKMLIQKGVDTQLQIM